jgi:hypothetical protein
LAWNQHWIAENKAVVAKASNSSKEITSSALRFTVTASGKDSVTLSGTSLDVSLSGYTGSAVTVNLYKGSATTSNLVWSTGLILGTTTTTVALSSLVSNNTIDAGNTNTFIVTVEWILPDSGSNNQWWTVKLNDLAIQAGSSVYNVSAYQNLGDLPLSETK